MKKFTLIIPVFQTSGILKLFLNSLSTTLAYSSQIIFINDGSGAEVSTLLKNFRSANSNPIIVIEHQHSQGCAVSINEAICLVDQFCDYVVFLDSDLILQNNWQDILIEDFIEDDIGIVGGLLLYPQTGGIQCCGITFQDTIGHHLYLNADPSYIQQKIKFEIQTTVFAFCAIRYEAMKIVGRLDEHFFNGYEDWDYQFRIRANGFIAVTDTRIQHYHWEKSNGIHRNYNRKNNLGRFWLKHGSLIKDDLCEFIKENLNKEYKNNKYELIDLCEAKILSQSIKNLLSDYGIDYIDENSELLTLCNNQQTIWLPEIMNSHSYDCINPYLFLCDHYVRLLDNKYWWMLRQRFCNQDLIVDTYGNVLSFEVLQNSFWPGTKIR